MLARLRLLMLRPLLLLLLLLMMGITGRAWLLMRSWRILSRVLRSVRLGLVLWRLLRVVAVGRMRLVVRPAGRLVIMTMASSAPS